jgi:hypothetical protein
MTPGECRVGTRKHKVTGHDGRLDGLSFSWASFILALLTKTLLYTCTSTQPRPPPPPALTTSSSWHSWNLPIMIRAILSVSESAKRGLYRGGRTGARSPSSPANVSDETVEAVDASGLARLDGARGAWKAGEPCCATRDAAEALVSDARDALLGGEPERECREEVEEAKDRKAWACGGYTAPLGLGSGGDGDETGAGGVRGGAETGVATRPVVPWLWP